MSLDREPCQKRRDVSRAHLGRMRLLMEHDVPADPVDIRLLGSMAVVPHSYEVPHPIEELRPRSAPWKRDDVRCLWRMGLV